MTLITKTTNRIHFSDLNPLRFEDLCLNLVSHIDNWSELNHFGRKGNDGGVDIYGIDEQNKVWYIQCKRFKKISKKELEEIILKVLNDSSRPDKLLLIVACDVSKEHYNYFKLLANEKGIKESEIWTASTLESKLYKDHKDLLFTYFGIRIENKEKDNSTKLKYILRMEKRLTKDLVNNERNKNNWKKILYNPSLKFISEEVIIHSVDDDTYPEAEEINKKGKISPWFRLFLYNFYHQGLEFWLDAGFRTNAIIDDEGNWEPLSQNDERNENSKFKIFRIKTIARINYFNIVDYKLDDEYYSCPHLYCKFNVNGMPYEKFYYRYFGDSQKEIGDTLMDESKRIIFPKD